MRPYLYAALAVAVMAGAGGLYVKGRMDATAAQEARDAAERERTDRRIDDADVGNSDPIADREWLFDRGR